MEATYAFLNDLVNRNEKNPSDGTDILTNPDLFRIWKYWIIESGLRPYF